MRYRKARLTLGMGEATGFDSLVALHLPVTWPGVFYTSEETHMAVNQGGYGLGLVALQEEMQQRAHNYAQAISKRPADNAPVSPRGSLVQTVSVKVVNFDDYYMSDKEREQGRQKAELEIAEFMAESNYNVQQHIVGQNLILIRTNTEYVLDDREEQSGE